jgi:hypothetical protein
VNSKLVPTHAARASDKRRTLANPWRGADGRAARTGDRRWPRADPLQSYAPAGFRATTKIDVERNGMRVPGPRKIVARSVPAREPFRITSIGAAR